jgi:choline dehydrogenase-like flavoprotein
MFQIIRPSPVADVVVIGSGAGGGTVTKVLADLGVNVTLSPRQEKVTRMYYGLGCQRPHSAPEMAQEFGVSEQVLAAFWGLRSGGWRGKG